VRKNGRKEGKLNLFRERESERERERERERKNRRRQEEVEVVKRNTHQIQSKST